MKEILAFSKGRRPQCIIVSALPLTIMAFLFLFITSCQKSLQEPQATSASDLQKRSGNTSSGAQAGINIVLNRPVTDAIIKELNTYGTVRDVLSQIKGLTLVTSGDKLAVIKNLPYVRSANFDAERMGAPLDGVAVSDFTGGINTWNLDAINVTNFGAGRTIEKDGAGVYIGVLDSGFPDSWRQYIPQERVAVQYATSFGGGGANVGNVSEQPNKWEHDQASHGISTTSIILGYQFGSTLVNGVAPKSTVIPVKVLNQNGAGWSSVIARGIVYIADLKAGALSNSPVVINMSLGGPVQDALETAAIDYAISKGVIVVASAGNEAEQGMSYPAAYAPVISAGSFGWINQWTTPTWWRTLDVADPTKASDFFIADYSSRPKAGQDLDVVAPGEWVVTPFQENSGQLSYFFVSGTSASSPHVAGIVALLLQQKSSLTAAQAEAALEAAAIPIPAGSRSVIDPFTGSPTTISWGADAAGSGLITADAALQAAK
jgi:hypothetical protein